MDPSLIPGLLHRMAEEFADECARWCYDPIVLIARAEDARAIRDSPPANGGLTRCRATDTMHRSEVATDREAR